MHVTILGGAGFLGRKLANRIAAEGSVAGKKVSGMTLLDLAAATPPAARFPVNVVQAGLDDYEVLRRAMPDGTGVRYVSSWMGADGACCYQLMEAPSQAALDPWIAAWSDLVEFEVVEVVESAAFWKDR
mgnify:CR=1 FL=1